MPPQAQAETAPKAGQQEPRAVSFAFLKGGTSKTTLSVNTARHLAERNGEGSTLFIDFDPSGHATRNFDYGHDGLYNQGTDLDKALLGTDSTIDPIKLTRSTPFKFDILPSTDEHENIKKSLSNEMQGSTRLKTRIVDPLLGDEYDYIIIDQPSDRGMMNNNGIVASQSVILPMLPAAETIESFEQTKKRLIDPLEELGQSVEILALVPNRLGLRIDQQTTDRELLEELNTNPNLAQYLPDFARITPEEWEKIDAGEMIPPKPGIRDTGDITNGMKQHSHPLLDYAPENDQNENFDELAAIIENGGVKR